MTDFRTPLPALRAVLFAAVGTALGTSAHHLTSSTPLSAWRVALGAAALLTIGTLGVRRPRSLLAMAPTCAAAQAGLHLWLTTGQEHSADLGTMPMAHAHETAPQVAHGSWQMTAGHTLAALLVAVLLQRADAACWALARGFTSGLRARTATVAALLSGRPAPNLPRVRAGSGYEAPLLHPGGTRLADVVVRRGPPVGNHA